MTARAARFAAERKAAETSLIVFQTLKQLGLVSPVLSERRCRKQYGVWFVKAVEDGRLVGVKNGNRTEYSVEEILALRSLELQQAKEQAEDYII